MAQVIFEYTTTPQKKEKPRYLTPIAIQDGADVILVYVFLTGYDTTTRTQVRRVKPNGQTTLIKDHIQTSVATAKEDQCTAIRVGKDLHVFFSSHVGDPRTTMEREIVPNVFVS